MKHEQQWSCVGGEGQLCLLLPYHEPLEGKGEGVEEGLRAQSRGTSQSRNKTHNSLTTAPRK